MSFRTPGTTSVDLFERFLERQDRKMSVMYRGSDRANEVGEKKNGDGITAQMDETGRMEHSFCQDIQDACGQGIDRKVIAACFGEGVEPLARFGLPDIEEDDAKEFRESAGFLSDRGAMVDRDEAADRLGVTLTDKPEEALQAATAPGAEDEESEDDGLEKTANAARLNRLRELVEEALRTANNDPLHDELGRFAPKGGSAERSREHQKVAIGLAIQAADTADQKSFTLGRVPDALAERVKRETNGARDIAGSEMRIDADFVRHARRYHPNLTDEDFHAIPEMLTGADKIGASETGRKLPAVEFHKRVGARDHLLVGASLNRQGHFQMTTLKKSAENPAL